MLSKRNGGPAARQWMETGVIILVLGILLYNKSPQLAMPRSYGWLWSGVTNSLAIVAKGHSFF
jgi:hypothetical protein